MQKSLLLLKLWQLHWGLGGILPAGGGARSPHTLTGLCWDHGAQPESPQGLHPIIPVPRGGQLQGITVPGTWCLGFPTCEAERLSVCAVERGQACLTPKLHAICLPLALAPVSSMTRQGGKEATSQNLEVWGSMRLSWEQRPAHPLAHSIEGALPCALQLSWEKTPHLGPSWDWAEGWSWTGRGHGNGPGAVGTGRAVPQGGASARTKAGSRWGGEATGVWRAPALQPAARCPAWAWAVLTGIRSLWPRGRGGHVICSSVRLSLLGAAGQEGEGLAGAGCREATDPWLPVQEPGRVYVTERQRRREGVEDEEEEEEKKEEQKVNWVAGGEQRALAACMAGGPGEAWDRWGCACPALHMPLRKPGSTHKGKSDTKADSGCCTPALGTVLGMHRPSVSRDGFGQTDWPMWGRCRPGGSSRCKGPGARGGQEGSLVIRLVL